MLFAAGLGDELWWEAVHTTVYLKNRSPTSALVQGMTPLQVFTGEIPKLTALIQFGAKGFKHVPKELRSKWEPNSIPGIFTGYAGTNLFRVLINCKIHITRDFDLAKAGSEKTAIGRPERLLSVSFNDDPIDDTPTSAAERQEPKPPIPEPPEPEQPAKHCTIPQTPQRIHTPGEFPQDTIEEVIHVRPPDPPVQEEVYSQRPHRTTAGKRTSTRFHDEQFSVITIHNTHHHSPEYYAYYTTSTTEPTTYTEATTGANKEMWVAAIQEELTSLHDNNTWVISYLPEGRTVVKCKWVFTSAKKLPFALLHPVRPVPRTFQALIT